ncbi:hypothetical protein J2741_000711 [Methanolinea mesophila]|uniref:hypothetical protein n=1 Tax=Methanolinea mesophila TaxID=547055 RepID=UPI001AE63148|nr:hypothetical protein [Methanolinea mesophila]MBP1928164.1 hypothetical protein [Methanolinea mesophila]
MGIGLLCTPCVLADRPVNATPETQDFSSFTAIDCLGTVTETDGVIWTVDSPTRPKDYVIVSFAITDLPSSLSSAIRRVSDGQIVASAPGPEEIETTLPPGTYEFGYTNGFIFFPLGTGILEPLAEGTQYNARYANDSFSLATTPLDPEEIHAVSSYREETVAVAGKTSYTKSMVISTANRVPGVNNLKAEKVVEFIGTETGRMTSSESILVDLSGNWSRAPGSVICPFAGDSTEFIPVFCNIATAGSTLDMTRVSLATSADTGFIAADAGVPVGLGYEITARGVTSAGQLTPASGSIAAYLDVHAQEAMGNSVQKAEDLAYTEKTTADGLITMFHKKMQYESGIA